MGRYLEMIKSPADMKMLTSEQLTTLAQEIRDELVTALSKSGVWAVGVCVSSSGGREGGRDRG